MTVSSFNFLTHRAEIMDETEQQKRQQTVKKEIVRRLARDHKRLVREKLRKLKRENIQLHMSESNRLERLAKEREVAKARQAKEREALRTKQAISERMKKVMSEGMIEMVVLDENDVREPKKECVEGLAKKSVNIEQLDMQFPIINLEEVSSKSETSPNAKYVINQQKMLRTANNPVFKEVITTSVISKMKLALDNVLKTNEHLAEEKLNNKSRLKQAFTKRDHNYCKTKYDTHQVYSLDTFNNNSANNNCDNTNSELMRIKNECINEVTYEPEYVKIVRVKSEEGEVGLERNTNDIKTVFVQDDYRRDVKVEVGDLISPDDIKVE